MGLLSPWFLVGLLALIGPLIAHLRRLSVQRRVDFSAVNFLDPRPPRSARKRWEDLLLLAARLLALGLLCFAFARPYLRSTPDSAGLLGHTHRVSVLLDTSASMRRGDLFSEALAKVRQAAASLPELGELEVLAFDSSVRSLVSFDAWRQIPVSSRAAFLKDALSAQQPGWGQTRLDEALRFVAAQHAADASSESFEVVVVSDFQEGTSLAGLQGVPWPEHFGVRLMPVVLPPSSAAKHVALHWVAPDSENGSAEAPFKLQVLAAPDFKGDSVQLQSEGPQPAQWLAAASAGRSRTCTVPGRPTAPAFIRVAGTGDFLSGVWVAPFVQARTSVALGGGGAAHDRTGSRYFVEQSLKALGEGRVETLAAETLSSEQIQRVSLWIASGNQDAALTAKMRASVESGAAALVFLNGEADVALLSALVGEGTSVREAPVEAFAVLGEIDRAHSLFSSFVSPQFSDFTGIRFWKYRRVSVPPNLASKVLARFEGGDPAVLEFTLGKGRVLVWSSGWRPSESQWVLSSRCVPFMSACLEWAGGGRRPFFVCTPGESVLLPEGSTSLRAVDGVETPIGSTRFSADAPGVYSIEPGGGVLVVNVAREETLLAPMDLAKLEALGVPGVNGGALFKEAFSEAGSPLALVPNELESRQGGWRLLLAAVLLLLVAETFWAARLSQGKGVLS